MTRRITKKKDKQREIKVVYNSNNIGRRLKSKSHSRKLIKNKDVLVKYGGNRVSNRDIHSVKIQRELSGGGFIDKEINKANDLYLKANKEYENYAKVIKNINDLAEFLDELIKKELISAMKIYIQKTLLNRDDKTILEFFTYVPDILTDVETRHFIKGKWTQRYKWNFLKAQNIINRYSLKNNVYRCINPFKSAFFAVSGNDWTTGWLPAFLRTSLKLVSVIPVLTKIARLLSKLSGEKDYGILAKNILCQISILRYQNFSKLNENNKIIKDVDFALTTVKVLEQSQAKQDITKKLNDIKIKYNSQKLKDIFLFSYVKFNDVLHDGVHTSFADFFVEKYRENKKSNTDFDDQIKNPLNNEINKLLEQVDVLNSKDINDINYFNKKMQDIIINLCVFSTAIKTNPRVESINPGLKWNEGLFVTSAINRLSYCLIYRDLGFYFENKNDPDDTNINNNTSFWEMPYYLRYILFNNKENFVLKDMKDLLQNIEYEKSQIADYKLTLLSLYVYFYEQNPQNSTSRKVKYINTLNFTLEYIQNKMKQLSENTVITSTLNYGFFIDFIFNSINYINTYESILTRTLQFSRWYGNVNNSLKYIDNLYNSLDGVGCTIFYISKNIITQYHGGFRDAIIRYQINSDNSGAINSSVLTLPLPNPNYIRNVPGFLNIDTQYVGEIAQIDYFIDKMAHICKLTKDNDKTETILTGVAARIAISNAAKHTNPYINEPINEYINPNAVATAAAVLMNKYFLKTTNRGDIVLNSLRGRELSTGLNLNDGRAVIVGNIFEDANVEAAAEPYIPVRIVDVATNPGGFKSANQGGLTAIRKSAEYMRILKLIPDIGEIMFEMIVQERTKVGNSGDYLMNINLQAHILSGLNFADAAAVNATFFNGANISRVTHAGDVAACGAIQANEVQEQINKLHKIAKEIGYGGMEVIIQMAINMSNAFCNPNAAETCRAAAGAAAAAAELELGYSSIMSAYASGFWDKTRLYRDTNHSVNAPAAAAVAGALNNNTFFHAASRSLISNNDVTNRALVIIAGNFASNINAPIQIQNALSGGHGTNNNEYSGGIQHTITANEGNPKSGVGAGNFAAAHCCTNSADLNKYKKIIKSYARMFSKTL